MIRVLLIYIYICVTYIVFRGVFIVRKKKKKTPRAAEIENSVTALQVKSISGDRERRWPSYTPTRRAVPHSVRTPVIPATVTVHYYYYYYYY